MAMLILLFNIVLVFSDLSFLGVNGFVNNYYPNGNNFQNPLLRTTLPPPPPPLLTFPPVTIPQVFGSFYVCNAYDASGVPLPFPTIASWQGLGWPPL